ncbi:isopentenyl-diphosphate Delta-isomerase [Kocuria sp.]|jgi:isopentenyl-diphosphate delta-isomerase|uniref:isopentenyl-diphosphate Delta-isomerase n=1 Tax=Kocuria sp. TaxID=1871328 RepID=UPI00281260FD|nr:isopentenyl-diphosphate Delta-isomerase [Kocuria sp.]HST72066.1 isopentenyl-diphosphate Delta-isomerase [Kocuria rosea]
MAPEEVVLLDDAHRPVGTALKAEVHTEDTPLHLAFSCYVLDDDGRLLLTRRALGKKTWPGVWTNSFCGHPGPGEEFAATIARRAGEELGFTVTDVTEVLPEFRYRAVDSSGIVENEFCPVYVARATGRPSPLASEVAETAWITPEQLFTAAEAAPFLLSPWLLEQIADERLRRALAGPAASGQ